jgi:hypothetical protein
MGSCLKIAYIYSKSISVLKKISIQVNATQRIVGAGGSKTQLLLLLNKSL